MFTYVINQSKQFQYLIIPPQGHGRGAAAYPSMHWIKSRETSQTGRLQLFVQANGFSHIHIYEEFRASKLPDLAFLFLLFTILFIFCITMTFIEIFISFSKKPNPKGSSRNNKQLQKYIIIYINILLIDIINIYNIYYKVQNLYSTVLNNLKTMKQSS